MNKTFAAIFIAVIMIAGASLLLLNGKDAEIVRDVPAGGTSASGNAPTSTPAETEEGPAETEGTIEARIDQGASAFGIKIVPLEVVEDSRCPQGVQCIWAGTVRLRALVTEGTVETEHVFVLGAPITAGTKEITLSKVLPEAREGVEKEPSDYRFSFAIRELNG